MDTSVSMAEVTTGIHGPLDNHVPRYDMNTSPRSSTAESSDRKLLSADLQSHNMVFNHLI
jgi:hypothetical protein